MIPLGRLGRTTAFRLATVQLAVFGFFGGVVTAQMADSFDIHWSWWVWTLIAWAVVTGLSALSVDIGAKVLGVLMGIELLSLIITAFAVLISSDKPEGIDLSRLGAMR